MQEVFRQRCIAKTVGNESGGGELKTNVPVGIKYVGSLNLNLVYFSEVTMKPEFEFLIHLLKVIAFRLFNGFLTSHLQCEQEAIFLP